MKAENDLAAFGIDGREDRQSVIALQNELNKADLLGAGNPGREPGKTWHSLHRQTAIHLTQEIPVSIQPRPNHFRQKLFNLGFGPTGKLGTITDQRQ